MRIAVAGSTGMIGAPLTALARAEGHEVVELTRSHGVDLTSPSLAAVTEALAGVDVVVDVTNGPADDPEAARAFFTTAGRHLGRAATAAGVRRTVALSIVGTDLSPEYGYYVAKTEQEQVVRAEAPGPVVLRATQFHEFPGQVVGWTTQDGVAGVMDVPVQPVDSAEVVRLLLELATATEAGDVDLAGPRVERLVDLARRVAEGSGVRVEAVPGPPSMAGGTMLPGPGAVVRGVDWSTWFAAQARAVTSQQAAG